ncbi:hypothetical protein RD110_00190 [Rhodoferax koreense]|uniref:Diguanylate cyclase n=2 Tax=Rhodoferax koreensis TaxID=1842727 RepID=A0A1P8K306_9BURK|nr:hypothetical protein RD110_00190 [Rhodoferax koreense]
MGPAGTLLGATQQQALTELAAHVASQLAWHEAQAVQARNAQTAATLDAEAWRRVRDIQQELAQVQLDPDVGLETVMGLITERVLLLTGADGSAIDLAEDGELVCRAGAGLVAVHVGMRFAMDTSLAGLSLGRNETVYAPDIEAHPLASPLAVRLMPEVHSLLTTPLRVGNEAIGVLQLQSKKVDAFGLRERSSLATLAESLGGIIQRYRMGQQLRASEQQYRMLFENNPYPMWVAARDSRKLLAVNRAAIVHYGYTEAEFLQMHVRDLWIDVSAQDLEARWNDTPKEEKVLAVPWRHRLKDGSIIDVEISSDAISFNNQAARLVLVHDVTQRRRAERDLARVSRAQHLLSACNEALVRAASEGALLTEICNIAVQIGGYSMAWVGFAQDDAERSIVAVANAGTGADSMKGEPLSWDADTPSGQGPAGRTIRSGEAVIVEDVARDPSFAPWLAQILQSGFRGAASLPLRDGSRTFGLFYLYAPEVVKIGSDEVRLLQQLANDLAFGILHLRAQESQRRLHAAVMKVAAGVSASTGTAFFEQLARNMAEALGAQAGFIVRLMPLPAVDSAGTTPDAAPPRMAHTMAGVLEGRALPNFAFALAGTPCDNLAEVDTCMVSPKLCGMFAGIPSLAGLTARTYVGRRLDSSNGEPAGLLFVLFKEPLQHSEFIFSTMQIFAARAAAELDRQDSDAQIRHQASLLDKAQDAIIVRGIDHRVLYWNQSAARLYGWTAEEVVGRSLVNLLYGDPSRFEFANQAVIEQGEWHGEIAQVRKDGSELMVEARWTLVRDANDQPHSIFAINTDITQRKATEDEIHKLAFFDALTQLPNRQLLTDRLRHALSSCARNGRGGALLFIDLDNFKTLNDTLGHDRGDLLLQQVARRLAACVRQMDTVARLGGDEFVVILEDLGEDTQEIGVRAKAIGEKILQTLSAAYQLEGNEHQSTCSIGITRFTGQVDSVGELLKQADIAMYQAKAAGRNTVRFFDPGLQAAVTARASLEADMRLALAQDEFFLHYQPQIDAQGLCTGVEALVRWHHPLRGTVSPAEFIPVAEETGLILEIGRQVLQQACGLLASWAGDEHTAHLSLAVNVSSRQFKHADFVQQVCDTLARSGADPSRLKLELTESLLVDDMELIIDKMMVLRAHGVSFSLDDFGTGYSSLAYLRRLPLDQLKIDQSFVRDVLTDPNDAVIARTIIGLGQSLGLNVIAEGVESAEQRDFLLAHGCLAYQGYFFSRPLALPQLEHFLQQAATPVSAPAPL